MNYADLPLLYLEDHPDTRGVMTKILRSWGFKVLPAESVASAMAIVQSEPVSMILADIGLPDGTGFEFFENVQKIRPIRGVALTAYGTAKDFDEGKRVGFHRHLLKPVNVSDLSSALADLVAAARSDRETKLEK